MPLRKVRTEDAERSGGRLVSEAVQRRPIESGPGKVVRFPASQCLLAAENEPVQEDPRSAKLASEDYSGPLRALGGRGKLVDGHRHFVASELEAELRRFSRL